MQALALLLAGSLVPVLVVVWLGLMNEGFDTFDFLFYPGAESWLQSGLLIACGLLAAAFGRATVTRVVAFARRSPLIAVNCFVLGLALTAALLYAVGVGETPWRKFYTYIVAPRAVSAWLLFAASILVAAKLKAVTPASSNESAV